MRAEGSHGQEVGGAEDHVGWPDEGWTGPAGEGDVEHGIFPPLLAATLGRVEGREVEYARKEKYDNGLLGLPEEDLYAVAKGRS
jgi:hypothetical protein